jgi:hypothetical protein
MHKIQRGYRVKSDKYKKYAFKGTITDYKSPYCIWPGCRAFYNMCFYQKKIDGYIKAVFGFNGIIKKLTFTH